MRKPNGLDRRRAVVTLHKAGYEPSEIFHLLKHDGYNRNFIARTIKRYTVNGTLENRKITGRVRSVRTKKFIEAVRQRIRRKSQRSARKMATQMKCSATYMRRVLKEDLKTRSYKKRRTNYLTAKQKKKIESRNEKNFCSCTMILILKICCLRTRKSLQLKRSITLKIHECTLNILLNLMIMKNLHFISYIQNI